MTKTQATIVGLTAMLAFGAWTLTFGNSYAKWNQPSPVTRIATSRAPCMLASFSLLQSCGGGGGTGGCTGSGGPDQPQSKNGNCSPIIIDTDGTGFHLTNAQDGVMFNFSGHQPIQVGWTAGGSTNAFLCLPDANGKCDDGADLFGNFTPQPPSAHPNGFAALALYDEPANGGNGDGVIDARDKIFSSLRLWIDANHDGICQPEELFTLPSLSVNSISLNYKLSMKRDEYGNLFRYRGEVNPEEPQDTSHLDHTTYDVFFTTAD